MSIQAWLNGLRVGDAVIVRYHPGKDRVLGKIEAIHKLHLVVTFGSGRKRFRRRDGWIAGKSARMTSLAPATPDAALKIRGAEAREAIFAAVPRLDDTAAVSFAAILRGYFDARAKLEDEATS